MIGQSRLFTVKRIYSTQLEAHKMSRIYLQNNAICTHIKQYDCRYIMTAYFMQFEMAVNAMEKEV